MLRLVTFKYIDLSLNKVSFQDILGANLKPDLNFFSDNFPRFDVKYSTRCTKKKRLNCKKKNLIIKKNKTVCGKRLQRNCIVEKKNDQNL